MAALYSFRFFAEFIIAFLSKTVPTLIIMGLEGLPFLSKGAWGSRL